MSVKRKTKKPASPLSPSDLKRLEEAFFTAPSKPMPSKKRKAPFFIYALSLTIILLIGLFYFKYTVFIVPKSPEYGDNLLSTQFLNSISFSGDKNKTQFSQGILYLSLDPKAEQEIILNLKDAVNLEENILFVTFSLINPSLKKGDMTFSFIVRNKSYFSTSVNPLRVVIDKNMRTKENKNTFTVPVDFANHQQIHMNFSQITQFRVGLLNSKNNPVSLLIREIKLSRKEEK